MKKMICVLVAIMLLVSVFAVASAESNSLSSNFTDRMKKAAENRPQADGDEASVEPETDFSFGLPVHSSDPFYQKVRSSAFLYEGSYSSEMNVLIELKNISGRTLYPSDATVAVYNAAGEMLDEETYCYAAPDMVENGGSLFIWEWFYSPDYPLSDVSYFTVTVESETSSYNEYSMIPGEALVSDGIGYALVTNATDTDIYGLEATIVVEDDEGVLRDVCEITTGNAVGMFPGSVMVLRDEVEDHENNTYLSEGNASAIVLYQID